VSDGDFDGKMSGLPVGDNARSNRVGDLLMDHSGLSEGALSLISEGERSAMMV
jgi:hypothetical protein